MPHLLVAITAHGLGHVAQTAPVVNALRRRVPTLRLTLYTRLPRRFLAGRFDGEFDHINHAPDVGMPMKNALEVDADAAARTYGHFHRHWQRGIAAEARLLAARAPDAVLANVPYRVLVAARRAGIPAVALCNLNWYTLYRHFFASRPGSADIATRILQAYGRAEAFLRPTPAMPMGEFDNLIEIGPIARVGISRRGDVRRRLGLAASDRLVVVSLGGIPTTIDFAAWPRVPGLHWVVPAAWRPQRDDAVSVESLDMDFVDVLRSADALVTKPGYGSFVEATCNGVPLLYAPRRDWPEEAVLVAWLQEHGRGLAISRRQLYRGQLAEDLQRLWALPPREPLAPTGIDDAVNRLLSLLDRP